MTSPTEGMLSTACLQVFHIQFKAKRLVDHVPEVVDAGTDHACSVLLATLPGRASESLSRSPLTSVSSGRLRFTDIEAGGAWAGLRPLGVTTGGGGPVAL